MQILSIQGGMLEQANLITNEAPEVTKTKEKFQFQETERARFLHAGNIMFGVDGDIFIHKRATLDKEAFLKILIHLHEKYIGD